VDADGGGAAGRVGPHQALALVLGLHELATNAAKHGALSRPEGRVEVRLSAAPGGGGALRILWAETGGPPLPDGPPARRGFGTRLLERALVQDLGPGSEVRLHFEPAGLRAEIGFFPSTGAGGRTP
jgi:two-component sensor histidine kinase